MYFKTMKLFLILVLLKGADCQAIWGPKEITVMEHEDLTVECGYQRGYERHEKYWCKERRFSPCSILARTSSNVFRTGLLLIDNKANRVIKIIMKDIQERHEGTYRCGISFSWIDEGSPVVVKVKKALPITPTKAKETVSPTAKPEIKTTSLEESEETKAPVRETLNGIGWSPTHTAAVISVGLLLLLICLLIATYIWRLKHRRRTQTQSNTVTLPEEQVEISYAEVRRPTKKSRGLYDEPIYANMSASGTQEQPPAGGNVEYRAQEQPPAGGGVEYAAIRC